MLSLGAYAGVLFSVHVPWGDVARHTFVPRLTADRAHLAALVAIFDTTVSPYLFFWQAAEEMEEHDLPLTPAQVRRMRLDVVAGIVAGIAVMFAILTATAVTLGRDGHTIRTADQAAQALRPLAGPFASGLFAAGVIGTGLLAVPVLAGSSAYAAAEAFHWNEGLSSTLRQAPGFYATIVVGMVVGVALNLLGIDPIRALYLSAILNGVAAPPILLLMILVSRADSLGRWRSGPLSIALVGATALVMAVLPVWYLLA